VAHRDPKRDDVAAALNERLAQTVPPSAKTVVQIGSGHGWLVDRLKTRDQAPAVYGVEAPGAGGQDAPGQLDGYFSLDLDNDVPPFDPGSIDCIVYADSLPRLVDPLAVLRRHRPLLHPSGTVSCSVPNLQHHSVVRGLLRGVFPYAEGTLLDPSYLRLFTSAGLMQLLLDAGFAPDTVERMQDLAEQPLVLATAAAAAPLFELLGVGAEDAERDLRTTRLMVRGLPLPDPGPDEVPMTFVACVNDDEQLAANLARSPFLRGGGPHELLVFRGCASAAEGLNAGIEQARNELVVLVHQDVYLPESWPARMASQWRTARDQGGPVGIAGVFGVLDRRVPFDAIGRVVHRDRLLSHRHLPSDVDGLDELLMVVPKDTPLRVEAALGWHLYGTDLALQAQQRGLRVVVLDATCHHNSLTGRVPSQYRHSERVLARKWEDRLPIHTNLSSIGSWLLDTPDGPDGPDGPEEAGGGEAEPSQPPSVTALVARLRQEQRVLNAELERARLQVASMQASPFWRARQAYARIRDRVAPRR